MRSIMRRVAAISAGPRSPRPRGRRAFSLSGLRSAIGYAFAAVGVAVVAATAGGGKPRARARARPRDRRQQPGFRGNCDVTRAARFEPSLGAERSRRLLAPLHA